MDRSQFKKIDDCENIYSENPLYLLINHASGYIEKKKGNKYLIFDDSVNENKADVWDGIKNEIKWNTFEKGGKLYPQVYSDDCLYELWKWK